MKLWVCVVGRELRTPTTSLPYAPMSAILALSKGKTSHSPVIGFLSSCLFLYSTAFPQATCLCLLHAGSMLGLLFSLEDRVDMFL